MSQLESKHEVITSQAMLLGAEGTSGELGIKTRNKTKVEKRNGKAKIRAEKKIK